MKALDFRFPRRRFAANGHLATESPIWQVPGAGGTVVLTLALIFGFSFAALSQESLPQQRVGTVKLQPEVVEAVNRGLAWLAKNQAEDGHWGTSHASADTALGLMAFLLQGHTSDTGVYGRNIENATAYLLNLAKKQQGYLGSPSNHAGMYEHGLAVLALSEAWGQSKNRNIGPALKKAVTITLRAQNPKGGWRYNPDPKDADMSMTGMHIVALNSAKEAGIYVPDATLVKAAKYVLSCQDETSGGFGYTSSGGPGFARTGAGVLSLILCGQRKHPSVKRGMMFLRAYPENKFTSAAGRLLYAQYYAIQCMYQSGDADFNSWYPKITSTLLSKQQSDGSWNMEEGAAYSTPMAILIIGVPYRFLPIYQR